MAEVFESGALPALITPHAIRARCIWVAFSGGLDSTVLLHALCAVRDRLPGPLRAVHLDHGLHPQSSAWAAQCRNVCAELGIPLTEDRLHIAPIRGESPEAAAREARYARLAALLGPGELLLTAQHRDDQAETLLLALLRGSGPAGLAAMPVLAPLGQGQLLRPLLDVPRAALAAYGKGHGLRWLDDPSNADTAFDRNFLRHRVLPTLRERWPALDLTLARSARLCGESAALLDTVVARGLAELVGPHPGTLSCARLRALEPAQCRAVLRGWLRREGFALPSSKRLERIVTEVLPAAPNRAPLVTWPGCEVRRYRDAVFALSPLPPAPDAARDLHWSDVPELVLPPGLGSLLLPPGLDPAAAGLQVVFRNPGLRCRPPAGPSRALKQLFQQAGVPPWLRAYVPLVLCADRLAAVAGVCPCGPRLSGLRWTGHPWQRLGLFRTEIS